MEVEYAFLADFAQTEQGKLYVIGGSITNINAKAFPYTHPSVSLAFALRIHPMEHEHQQTLEIQVWDPDGKRLAGVKTGFKTKGMADDPSRDIIMPFSFNFQGLLFAMPAIYSFRILVNGEERKSVQLHLLRPKIG